ncbi:hypothetical protein K3557_05760 [Leisingera sp. M523]|nr:hypothetical protein K3557_05760 [Leisingera sp. M523]
MVEELKETGLDAGHRRVGSRLSADWALSDHLPGNGCATTAYPWCKGGKHKVTTVSDYKFNIAPNLPDRNFMADAPNYQ